MHKQNMFFTKTKYVDLAPKDITVNTTRSLSEVREKLNNTQTIIILKPSKISAANKVPLGSKLPLSHLHPLNPPL